ncbi:MAG TPA: DUF6089 family protein [Bacteroidia bacterium]|nr:DUF6089 family protein [Bacteroidia bacterium]
MLLKKLFLAAGIAVSTIGAAQDNVEIGLMLGGTNYIGDMTESQFQEFNPAVGLMLRYNPNYNFSIRGNALYGSLNGDDENFVSEEKRRRNLDFTSPLFEFSGQVEWNILGYDALGKNKSKRFTPYLFAGVGIFKFNPWTKLEDDRVELQPLGTEGQGTTPLQNRKKYALTQVSLPFGLGIKFMLAPRLNVGLEYGRRFTFTDYIDDVSLTYVNPVILQAQYGERSAMLSNRSGEEKGPYDIITQKGQQRGDNKDRDWYNFLGITISYTINLRKEKCYQF